MANQLRVCELKCKYNIQGLCTVYGNCISKDLFIEELEKIRNEITMLLIFNRENVVEVIDKHIAELKGENE